MINEYALEPELVATWIDRRDCRYLKESFGIGKGRLVSRYPKGWKKLVWEAAVDAGDFERKRLDMLLAHLSEQMVRRRNYHYDLDSGGWIDNAEIEHHRSPFHAIVSRSNPKNQSHVLKEDDIFLDESAHWAVSDMLVVVRKGADLARAVAPLLRCSSHVILVDPHFGPERPRYRRTLRAYLEQMVRMRPGRAPHRVEVHTAAEGKGTEGFFQKECESRLRPCVPKQITLTVRRLREKTGGEKLHNRYILTDLGGVTFGIGLDDGDVGQTDDLALMDRCQYTRRWNQYSGDPPVAFEQVGDPVEVAGTRRLRSL